MKKALVTGAAKRIGKSIAEYLLENGYSLYAHANNSVDELSDWVKASPYSSQVEIIRADLCTKDGQKHLIDTVLSYEDPLDLLVHNASSFKPVPFAEITKECFNEMLEINLTAPFFITQGLLSLLRKAAAPCVINLLDAMWQLPCKDFSHYAVSKAGLAILTKSLAIELAPDIRVNGISPGAILFQPFHDDRVRKKTLDSIPQQRLGSPIEIAQAVLYLSQANYINGEILVVDGGRSIYRT